MVISPGGDDPALSDGPGQPEVGVGVDPSLMGLAGRDASGSIDHPARVVIVLGGHRRTARLPG